MEAYVRWRNALDEVARAKPLLTSKAKFSMGNKLQSGAAKDLFFDAARRVEVVGMDAEEQQVQAALEALNKWNIPLDDLANQRAYMHYFLAYLPSYDSSSM